MLYFPTTISKGVLLCIGRFALQRIDQVTKKTRSSVWANLMIKVVENRFGSNGKPPKTIEWLTDNCSCYTASETRSFAKELGLKPVTTPVTSPQSNGMSASFVKMLKRDYAKLANRPDSKTVMAQLKDCFDDYNSYHPHSALVYLPPTLFREKRSVA
jgi:putative transposase